MSLKHEVRELCAVNLMSFMVAAAAGCDPVTFNEVDALTPADIEQRVGQQVERQDDVVVLASLALEEGHEVRFIEPVTGVIMVLESGRNGEHTPWISQELRTRSPVELYRALAPSEAIPEALVQGQGRRARPSATSAPPFEDPGELGAIRPRNDGEQEWFREAFCDALQAQKCVQGVDWATSGWDYTNTYRAIVMVGSEGVSWASAQWFYWKGCDGDGCGWQTLHATSVEPGNWVSFLTENDKFFWFKAELFGASLSTQVSLSVVLGDYECASCNDGSCQCGYLSERLLCDAHHGVHPGIDCVF